jgi:hypothetical protein
MVTKRTGRDPWRPRLPLREDKERHALVYFTALRRIARKRSGASARFVALTMTQLRYGRPVESEENIQAMRDGRPFEIVWMKTLEKQHGDEKGSKEHPRNKSAFHAMADDFARKERRLGKLDGKTEDGRWFEAMAGAWMLCLDGNSPASFAMAARLATSVNEFAYFEQKMAPMFIGRCNFLPVPDFLPHD